MQDSSGAGGGQERSRSEASARAPTPLGERAPTPLPPAHPYIRKPRRLQGDSVNETDASEKDQLSRIGKRALLVILLLAAGLRVSHLVNHVSQGLSDPESAWSGTDMSAFAI